MARASSSCSTLRIPCGAASPVLGLASPRPSSSGGLSPAATATPTSQAAFERRFGTALFQESSPTASCEQSPRRARGPGVTKFTDATNPSNRLYSRNVAAGHTLKEARVDTGRAGARTKNPGVVRAVLGQEHLSPREARERCIPHRYTNEDGRTAKALTACGPNGQRSPKGLLSDGVSEILGGTAVGGSSPAAHRHTRAAGSITSLGNYLNDMKNTGRSRKAVPAEPSEALRKMNDGRHILPAQMSADRRSTSCDFTSTRRTASVESDRDATPSYGFTRKQQVVGRSARRSHPGFLGHPLQSPSSQPTTPRGDRLQQADQRFEELVAHIKVSTSPQKEQRSALRAQDRETQGFLDCECVVKFAV